MINICMSIKTENSQEKYWGIKQTYFEPFKGLMVELSVNVNCPSEEKSPPPLLYTLLFFATMTDDSSPLTAGECDEHSLFPIS